MYRLFGFLSGAILLLFVILVDKGWILSSNTSPSIKALKSLSPSERTTLEVFFRTLLKDSQCGYVLYGNKPICTEGILLKDDNLLMIGGELHERSIILKRGIQILQNLGITGHNYFIYAYKKPSYGWNHLLFINRQAFFEAVKKNLSLFQYVLGPGVTADRLFAKLTDPEESLYSVFKKDKVLDGIVLGFGQQNALYGSRLEEVNECAYVREEPPFKPIKTRITEPLRPGNLHPQIKVNPSFGYTSLEQEAEDLNKSTFISKDLVTSLPLIPWFSCLKGKETSELINGFLKAQEKIRKVLASDNFLEEIFARFFEGAEQNIQPISAKDLDPKCDFSKVIGLAIFQSFWSKDAEWIKSFTQGMRACNANQGSLQEPFPLLAEWYKASRDCEAKRNLLSSEKFFESISRNKDLVCLVPDKLYYRKIKEGKGRLLHKMQGPVVLDCSISNHEGEGLSVWRGSERYAPKLLDVENLLPSFAMAIQGMAEEEEREIFVHPALAYGESDNIEPNIGLIARVKLVETPISFEKEEDAPPLDLVPLAAENNSEKELKDRYKKLDHQLAFQLGAKTWAHYKKGQEIGYTLNDVIRTLYALQNGEHIDSPKEADQLLTLLHWNLYQCDRRAI